MIWSPMRRKRAQHAAIITLRHWHSTVNRCWKGARAAGVVVLEFAAMAAAKAWYHNPAYQETKAHRLKDANYRMLLVNGAA